MALTLRLACLSVSWSASLTLQGDHNKLAEDTTIAIHHGYHLYITDLNNIWLSTQNEWREFELRNFNEETLGEFFSYFMLETVLIGKLLNIDPFNQPAVEDVKTETIKNLIWKSPKNNSGPPIIFYF